MKFNCKIVSFKANKGSSHLFNNDLLGHNHCPAYHLFRAVNYNHKAVMDYNSCSRGRGFESRRHILDGHFSHLFVVKIVFFV